MSAIDDLRKHLKELEERLFRDETRHSTAAIETLLSKDFREIGRSGRFYCYGEIVAALLTEVPDGLAQAEDFDVQLLAETIALATYRSVRKRHDGKIVETLRSSTWRLEEDDTWRMVFHQGTPI